MPRTSRRNCTPLWWQMGERPRDPIRDELRLLTRVEQIARHLRAVGSNAEALAVENLGVAIEAYADTYRPRP